MKHAYTVQFSVTVILIKPALTCKFMKKPHTFNIIICTKIGRHSLTEKEGGS